MLVPLVQGKSEIIQSYILSLAINFHPHEVAFLLIDYKGGVWNLFKDLVHLVGTITNLDGDEAMRALTSIKAELRKRQRLFESMMLTILINTISYLKKVLRQNQCHIYSLFPMSFAELKIGTTLIL